MKEIVISKRRLFIVSIIVLVLIFLCLIVVSSLSVARDKMMGVSSASAPSMGFGESQSSIKMIEPYYNRENPTISDTREFLKTSYSSTLRTRNVSSMIKEVRNAIKGADGRIDNFYSSEKSGSISFVVAKSKFEDLRSQIEGMTYAKLYTESVSSQNLLSQKQNIEEQTVRVVSSLESLQKQKDDLTASHTQKANAINIELARLRSELANTQSATEKSDLLNQQNIQNQKLSTENSNYAAQSKNLDARIANENSNLSNVNKQDDQFADNIETVNGYVAINWVSWWQLVKIYSPVSPVIIIIVLVIIAWILLRRKGYLPKIIIQ
ncbi:MAG: hypothetical protein WCV68_00430 [Candidatus Paceibacterota bacterium]